MHFSTAFAVVALAVLAQAQVPTGFKPSVNTKLEVIYNSTMIMEAGQLFGKADVQTQPKIALTSAMAKASETYMFVMIDLDVPPRQRLHQTPHTPPLHEHGLQSHKATNRRRRHRARNHGEGPVELHPPWSPPPQTPSPTAMSNSCSRSQQTSASQRPMFRIG
ncbi:hypothetical protein A1F94_013046 [Pyrenophora tritici-repentis]|nr:hypothetical protein A1F94_013046 [Pyrenophora tritici-repentis]